MSAKRLLILEDHPGLGQLVKDLFIHHGYDVTLCTNGEQGLQAAQDHDFDGIISDIKMPIMDGLSFLKAIREHPPKTKLGPVIMYSNFAYEYSKDDVLALGAVDFIAKDAVPLEDLVKLVESHL